MRRYRKDTRLEVEWVDIVQHAEWMNEENAAEPPEALCHTLGYYLTHDDEFLYLSSTVSGKERDRTALPLGVIKKVRTVRP
jgi:hypothetical protein